MRRNQPLAPRQVEVLQWIAKGCPAGVWQDFSYKTTAYALAVRGLVTVDRRRNEWSAQLTDDGRFYILNGSYPSDTIPNGGAGSSLNRPKVTDLAAELLVQLTSAGGQLTVPSPTDRQRAMYRRAIHRLITGHYLPEGFVLRHTGRDHGDLTIRLQHADEVPRRPPSPKVTVPPSSVAITDDVRDLVSGIRLPVTERTMERALRILQAVANECAVRGWSMNRDPEDDSWLKIITSDGAFQLSLREQLVDCDVPDEATLSTSKYSWQRIPLQARKVGSGRLTLQLGKYYPTRSWSDRSRWSLDDKLGALFAELDAQVAEAVEERRRREADLLRRQQAWDAAVLAAKKAYVVDLNRRRLDNQVDSYARARKLREYARALTDVIDSCQDATAANSVRRWQQWASDEADRVDPVNRVDVLCYVEPDSVAPEDYAPFMPAGMNAQHRPTQ